MGTQRLPLVSSPSTTSSVGVAVEATTQPGDEIFSGIQPGSGGGSPPTTMSGGGYSMINSSSSAATVVLIPTATTPTSPTSSAAGSTTLGLSPGHRGSSSNSLDQLMSSASGKHRTSVLNHENLRIKSQYVRRYLKHNPLINCLLPISCIVVLIILVFLLKDFPKHALQWVERQEANSWGLVLGVVVLFIIVSFPVTVGYLVLIITSGYLFGFLKGLLVVVAGANVGVAVAHYVIKSLQNRLPVHKLIKNETGRAILRVISGPRAFKVVLFCRLTPIPFGLQNTIFGVSAVSSRSYHTATLLGLLPAQTINVYLGSTLRSMRDVLNDHKTAFAGYAVFAVEVLVGVLLMLWVIQKARMELSNALLADIGVEEKLLTYGSASTTATATTATAIGSRMQIVPLVWLKKMFRLTKNSFRSWRLTQKRNSPAHKPCRTV